MKANMPSFAIKMLFAAVLTQQVAEASSPPAGSVRFYPPVDPEQLQSDDPRPAGKWAADLNVGDPRTVRLFYLLPNDRTERTEVVDSMKAGILDLQTFFANQMEAHGHGRKTFQFEADDQGDPVVHRVDGDYSASQYSNSPLELDAIERGFDISTIVILVVRDITSGGGRGRAADLKKNNGIAEIDGWDWFAATHELGHAFDLNHDFRDRTYIMSYGRTNRSSASLSACAADFLATHPYFNSAISLEDGTSPTIELTSPTTYPAGSESLPIRLRLSDSDGLHQAILLVPSSSTLSGGALEVKACLGLENENDRVIEFAYDGIVPSSSPATSFFNPAVHKFSVIAVDTEGNTHKQGFSLRPDTWERGLGTLEGRKQSDTVALESHTLAFSPDGATLAVAYDDGTVNLWNVSTRTNLTTFRHGSDVQTVAFSPDGTTLASGGLYGHAKLWDIATQTNIATFSSPLTKPLGHSDSIDPVVFSPDGTTLAWGSSDRAIRLWDIATRTSVATLEGHASKVNTLAFSPDGTMLASGSLDRTVKLWDMTTLTNLAIFAVEEGVYSVAFSPDGTTLAAGATNKTVVLWDLVTREKIVRIGWPGFHSNHTNSVAFTPDGSILASIAHWRSSEIYVKTDVSLFDMTAPRKEIVATISAPKSIQSVAISPDGTVLATRLQDGNVMLWDTSEWAGTPVFNHPPTGAVTISGAAEVGETLTADASAVEDPDGPLTLEFSYQWLADLSPIAGATSQTYTLTANEIGKTVRVRVSYLDGLGAPVNVASGETEMVSAGICGRTEEVQTAILEQIDGVSDCAQVTDAHLAAINALGVDTEQLTALPAGMFKGLGNVTYLEIYGGQLTTLPAGAFEGLTNLSQFSLRAKLATLPARVFDPLTNLTALGLVSRQLTSLPDGIFDRLTNLTGLEVRAYLSSLPAGIFDQLTSLTHLELVGLRSTSLPDGIFDQLTSLTHLGLDGQLTSLPDGLFVGLSSLTALNLSGNAVKPLPLTVSLEKTGRGQFKAVAPTGAPFDIVLPLNISNGSIDGGANTITIPAGSVESRPLTVTRTSGTTLAVTADVGTLPGLPGNHTGYALVKSSDLPLEIFGSGETGAASAATDFNGDGRTDFADFFLFADAYGGTDSRFDLDRSGRVDFADFFRFVDAFGT